MELLEVIELRRWALLFTNNGMSLVNAVLKQNTNKMFRE